MKTKNVRRFVAVLLSMVMMFTFVSSAMAGQVAEIADLAINQNEISQTISDDGNFVETSFATDCGSVITLAIITRDYGYALYEYIDGVLVRSTTLYHNQREKVYITYHGVTARGEIATVEAINFSDFTYYSDMPTIPDNLEFNAMMPSSVPNWAIPVGVISYAVVPNFNSPITITHEIRMHHDGGWHFNTGVFARMVNATLTMASATSIMIAILGFVPAVASSAAGTILNMFGLKISVGTFLVANTTTYRVNSMWEFIPQAVMAPGLLPSDRPPVGRSIRLQSYSLHSLCGNIRETYWPRYGNIEASMPLVSVDFRVEAFQATFGSWSGILHTFLR